eukprot:TRINITY_DN67186_c10_g1_i1.p1 TRINITY_DN67186_c10_g1~~TRINITY_DN67186_c10_g1_i1.p1  ORF type:complete len:191 (+),score=3.48 TRINITY_DN67186_c10_g1_i1:35-607(+)
MLTAEQRYEDHRRHETNATVLKARAKRQDKFVAVRAQLITLTLKEKDCREQLMKEWNALLIHFFWLMQIGELEVAQTAEDTAREVIHREQHSEFQDILAGLMQTWSLQEPDPLQGLQIAERKMRASVLATEEAVRADLHLVVNTTGPWKYSPEAENAAATVIQQVWRTHSVHSLGDAATDDVTATAWVDL